MARHLHVVGDRPAARHRREAEDAITRRVELVVSAVAALAGPILHASLPALPGTGAGPRGRRGGGPRRIPSPDLV